MRNAHFTRSEGVGDQKRIYNITRLVVAADWCHWSFIDKLTAQPLNIKSAMRRRSCVDNTEPWQTNAIFDMSSPGNMEAITRC